MTKVVVKDLKGRETVYEGALMTLHHSGALMVIKTRPDGSPMNGIDSLLATIPSNAYTSARTVYAEATAAEDDFLETNGNDVTWIDGFGMIISVAESRSV